jgi:hypothetical protein
LDNVENDLVSVSGWRKMARDRDAWKFIPKETRVLHVPPVGEERVGSGDK